MSSIAQQNSRIRISVVIATLNRRHVLQRTLPTILNQDFPRERYEVIVVIDGSTDDTAKMLSELVPACTMRVLAQSNRGPAAARNCGINAAKGEIILFLDDDVLCESGLLRQHAAAHERDPGSLVVGRTILADGSPETAAREFRSRYNDLHFPSEPVKPTWPEYASVCNNTSMRRELCLEFGGFDETFSHVYEDVEFGLRLHSAGVKLQYIPGALTEEIYKKSTEEVLASSEALDGKAELLLCSKHPEYRSYSSFAAESLWKGPRSWVWFLLISISPMIQLPLKIASRLLELFLGMGFLSQVAVRLFGIRLRIATLVGAIEQAGSWQAIQNRFGRQLSVLLYHHVGPGVPGTLPSLTICPEKFAAQIRWLFDHKYRVISPQQWREWWRTGIGLPAKAVLLTFDDAYSDICQHALPVLRRYGYTAEIFVVTGLIGSTDNWNSEIATLPRELMSSEQIHDWRGAAMEFGAHSRTHSDLRELSHLALLDEVAGSSDDLKEIVGMRPCSFAFPYGRLDDEIRETVRKHYEMAFTVEEGLNGLATDLHSLHRTMVQPRESLFEFGLRVRFGRNPLIPVRRVLSRIKKSFSGRRS